LGCRHGHPFFGCRIAHHIIYYLGAGKLLLRVSAEEKPIADVQQVYDGPLAYG
jgi:hypothetical protein